MMPSRRTLVLICGASLLANLFMAGFFLVPMVLGPDQRLARLAAIAAVGRAPREVTDLIDAGLTTDRDTIHAAFGEMREARRNVREAMRAEPFDAAALDNAFAELRAKSALLQETVQRSVARAVAAAPAETRAKIEVRRDRTEGRKLPPP